MAARKMPRFVADPDADEPTPKGSGPIRGAGNPRGRAFAAAKAGKSKKRKGAKKGPVARY